MKNGLRVFFYLLAVATCLAAPNKAEAQVAEPLYHWRAVPGDTLMNSNPAAYAGGIILLQDSIPYAPDYTVIVVYKPVQDTEARANRGQVIIAHDGYIHLLIGPRGELRMFEHHHPCGVIVPVIQKPKQRIAGIANYCVPLHLNSMTQ